MSIKGKSRKARDSAHARWEQLQRERRQRGCRGYNYHVFALGELRCSICGKERIKL